MYRRAVDELTRRLAVARGDEPADLVVRGGRVLSVFTREWLETDVAVVDGFVAGLGEYEGAEELDASIATLKRMYGDAYDAWLDVHAQVDPDGVFDSPFSKRVGISQPPLRL